jgi:streptogramin lyase
LRDLEVSCILAAGMGAATGVKGIRDACRCVVLAVLLAVIFAAPAQAAPTSITEYPVEVGHSTNIDHIAVGADGTVWFADGYWPEGSFRALIGRFDPSDGAVAEFDQGLNHFSVIRDFVAGPDGNMWFADSGSANAAAAIGKITPSGQITEYASPVGGKPWWIIVGPDESLWYTATRAVGRVTAAGALGAYELPGVLGELAAGPDGNVWFTYGSGANAAIGRIERHSDGSATITLFQTGLDPHSVPERIVAAGGYLWFTDLSGAEPALGRVSPDGQITEFREGLAADSNIIDIAAGPDGNVWFTDNGVGAIGRITPAGQITEFTDEDINPFVYYRNEVGFPLQHLVVGPDGNMWFTIPAGRAVLGKITPTGEITTFRPGENGLSWGMWAQEIAVGLHGELWFDGSTWDSGTETSRQMIARIFPGDDNPPNAPPSTAPASKTTTFPGRVVVMGGRTLKLNRYGLVRIRLSCQSPVTACDGELQLTIFVSKAFSRRKVGSVSFSLAPGVSQTMSLPLDRLGRDLLATKHRRRGELSIVPLSNVTMEPVRLGITSLQRRG